MTSSRDCICHAADGNIITLLQLHHRHHRHGHHRANIFIVHTVSRATNADINIIVPSGAVLPGSLPHGPSDAQRHVFAGSWSFCLAHVRLNKSYFWPTNQIVLPVVPWPALVAPFGTVLAVTESAGSVNKSYSRVLVALAGLSWP